MPIEVSRARVARVTINRPEMRNALDARQLADLEGAVRHLALDPGVRVIVLTGQGEHFSSGADLGEVLELEDKDQARKYFGAVAAVMAAMVEAPKPVLAQVRGYCLAGAMGLVAAADIVLAAEGATFGLPEVAVGLFPMVVSSLLMPQVGARRLADLALTGRMMTAEEARGAGLVTRLVPEADLDRVVQETAEALSRRSAEALAAGKQALWRLAAPQFREDVAFLREAIAELATGETARAEMRSFFERRKGRGKKR